MRPVVPALSWTLTVLALGCVRPQAATAPRVPAVSPAQAPPRPSEPWTLDFVSDVRPILLRRCVPCHETGGRMYERLPFDVAGTIREHGDGVLRRIKEPAEHALIEAFLAQEAQSSPTAGR